MRRYKGSFTIEAAFIIPIILFIGCLTIELGVALHQEVRGQAIEQMKEEPMDVIGCMYRKEFLEELSRELYED